MKTSLELSKCVNLAFLHALIILRMCFYAVVYIVDILIVMEINGEKKSGTKLLTDCSF